MASDNPFVRGSPQRNSHNNILSRGTNQVEYARQKALQAADLYHNTVVGRGDTGGVVKSSPSVPAPSYTSYAARQNDKKVEDSRQGHHPATPTSDAYYKQKLRSGFIDLRNSYSEKRKPRNAPPYRAGVNDTSLGFQRSGKINEGQHKDIRPYGQTRNLGERRGLYRSNSSLELENMEYATQESTSPLRRDYGSTSSLDVIGISNETNSFFQMLQDYRNENWDQRAPAPPQMQDLLQPRSPTERSHPRVKTSLSAGNFPSKSQPYQEIGKVSNGNVAAEEEGSPKLKSKSQKSKERKGRNKSVVSEGSGGLFKKLRGGGATTKDDVETGRLPESNALTEANDLSQEEKLRKKSVSHFDCQSLMFNLTEYIKERTQNVEGKMSRKNRTTGASAASGNQHSEESEQTDAGDGKSNDLVYSCPFFRNELGGEEERTICLNRKAAQKRVQHLLSTVHMQKEALIKRPACNGISCLDSTASGHGVALLSICSYRGLVLEFADHGALYYRSYFRDSEHQNFFGVEDSVGPLAISLKREKLNDDNTVSKTDKKTDMSVLPGVYQYRFIVRTSQLHTLRGSILEDVIPSTVRATTSRGIPPKDVLEYLLPELNLSCLRVANSDDKTAEQLVKLDEQGVTRHYKFGVKYCRAGQSSEEEMYNNEHGSAVFEEFLDCIGRRVQLQGFDKYRGGLDCKCNSTGTHSLFTEFLDYEIMFHVSTLLPFTANNKQQLLRKRHIGNDIVTIVFQEPGSLPFTPKSVRSHFQHVFIIVRAHVSADSHSVKYSIAVSRSKDVPPFGPPIPDGALFTKGPEFAEFLLTKAMNAENAVHKSDKFTMMAVRTRAEYLKDLATNHVSSATLESTAKISKFSLSTKKKERGRNRSIPDSNTRGAVAWNLQVEDFGSSSQFDGILAIAMDTLVIVEEESKEVVFYCPTKAIIGWTSQTNSLRLYYDHGECVAVSSSPDDIQEVVNRLYVVSSGCETVEMALRRNTLGQLGFHVHFEGIVSDVEQYGFAWQTGLRAGSRLVEVCKVAMATLTHDQMIDLLRTSNQVKVVMIPAYADGTPRSGVDELRSSHAAFLAQCTTSQTDSPDYSSDSSRSTVTGGAANRSVTDPRYLSPSSSGSANYSDLRTMSSYLDSKSYQSAVEQKASTSVSHNYTSSHDSTGTRSSGHGSEGVAHGDTTHRPDNLSSEGFVSGGDSLERERSQQNTAATYGGYSGQVKGYTPYGKDLHSQLTGGEVTSWPSQLPTSSSLDYVSSKNPPPRSTGFSNLAPRPYVNPTAKDSRTTSYITMADVTATRHKGRDEPAKETKVETYSKSTRFDLSPRSNTENTQPTNMNPSDDSRHRGNPHRKTSTPSGGKHGGSSHFEEDLKRLINPDISFTDTDEKPLHLTQYTRSPRPRQRLLRTLSDESMCGTLPRDKVTRHKVKDTTDTQLRPTTLESRVGGSQPLNKSSPNIPLPEDGADWNALVDTATKAFPQGSRESTEAIGSNEEVTVRDATHSPASQTSTAKTTGSWGRGDSSKSDKIQQLEKRVTQLEKQLEKERREKADLETEVSRLRRDNVQLQEESQTAAAQLRKFTEWFFQTIDRQ